MARMARMEESPSENHHRPLKSIRAIREIRGELLPHPSARFFAEPQSVRLVLEVGMSRQHEGIAKCKLGIGHCKLACAGGRSAIFNSQFSMANLQFSYGDSASTATALRATFAT